MLGREPSSIFLSYARKDGEEFAGRLRERLTKKAPDIHIKHDRWSSKVRNIPSVWESRSLYET
jgi:hypothetical protein